MLNYRFFPTHRVEQNIDSKINTNTKMENPATINPSDRAIAPQPTTSLQKASPLTSQPTNLTTKRARGSSFTTIEDTFLTRAWIFISEDAVVGTEHKGEVFYSSVKDYFESNKLQYCSTRNLKSI